MKKQTILALSLLVSMGAANAAVPAWMNSVGTFVANYATTAWNSDHVQGSKNWVVATQPTQFIANRPVSAGLYAVGATAAFLARKKLVDAAKYVGGKINSHRKTATAIAMTLVAGIVAAIKYDKVPAFVDNGTRTVGKDVANAAIFGGTNLGAGLKGLGSFCNNYRKTALGIGFAGLCVGMNRLGAREHARRLAAQHPVAGNAPANAVAPVDIEAPAAH